MKTKITRFLIGFPVLAAILSAIWFVSDFVYLTGCKYGITVARHLTCESNPIGLRVFFGALEISISLLLITVMAVFLYAMSSVIGEELTDKTRDAYYTLKAKKRWAKEKEVEDQELKGAITKAQDLRGALSKK
jgi:hypothetical protein